jgi:lipoprotein-releasing system ATP-binding protein
MLSLVRITKSYPMRGLVLDNLDLVIKEGDTISVAGPSGSGKTTLLNIAGLLTRPDAGELFFMGNPVLDFDNCESAIYRSRNIGFVFQEHLLLPYLNILENIMLPLLAADLKGYEFNLREQYAKELMEKVGIVNLAEKYPGNISGGEAQRAALVRALINKPSILLADEPTGSLDKLNAGSLGDLLIEMNRLLGISILLATHSESLADRMSTKYYLENGKLKQIR